MMHSEVGHSSIVTTPRYARLTDEAAMREAARLGAGEGERVQ